MELISASEIKSTSDSLTMFETRVIKFYQSKQENYSPPCH